MCGTPDGWIPEKIRGRGAAPATGEGAGQDLGRHRAGVYWTALWRSEPSTRATRAGTIPTMRVPRHEPGS